MKRVVIIDENDLRKMLNAVSNIETEIQLARNPVIGDGGLGETLKCIEGYMKDLRSVLDN